MNLHLFYEKYRLLILTMLNLLLAATLAGNTATTMFSTYKSFLIPSDYWPDFTAYYTAARILHLHTGDLYTVSAYQDLYDIIRPLSFPLPGEVINIDATYRCPPTLALLLYPLGFFTLKTAYILFAILNLVLMAVIIVQIRVYLKDSPLANYTLFLQSMFISVFPVFVLFIHGQNSLITLALLMGFLLSMRSHKLVGAALLLSIMIGIKPQYFIPLWCALMGQRQWKASLLTGVFGILQVVFYTMICGVDIWEKYIHLLSIVYYADLTISRVVMVNLEGMLDILLGWAACIPISKVINLCYLGLCLYALSGIFFRKAHRVTFPVIIAITLLFSPHMLIHDMVLFLPVGLSLCICLYNRKHRFWLILCYLLAVWTPVIFLPYSFFAVLSNYQALSILLTILIVYFRPKEIETLTVSVT